MKFMITCMFCLISLDIISQCCSPGNPIGGAINLGTIENGTWKLIGSYRHSYSGRYFEGTKAINPYFVKNGYFDHIGIVISHAISSRITFDIETNYFLRKSQVYLDGIIPEQKTGFGIADLVIVPKFNLFRKNNWEITMGLGLKIPVGPYNKKFNGAIAELDIQPSSGAFDIIPSLFIMKNIPEHQLRFFIYHRSEFKGTNPLRYQYGNLYSTSFYISHSLSSHWDFIIQLRNELRSMDKRPAQTAPYEVEKISISGSNKIFFTPQINFNANPTWNFSVLVDIPVYQYYNEQQLANTYAIGIVLYKKIMGKTKIG
jgi:Putative MetA-pathway of phenol degradation